MKFSAILIVIIMGILGCSAPSNPPSFDLKSPEETGVYFSNSLEEGPNTNVLMYEYFYNGGGVATADFNGDGWLDLYFTSNMGSNKLYVNKGEGGFSFEDFTASSGTAGRMGPWKTGVSIVDINSDGRPDIYLCYSGAMPEEKRRNQLFINTTPTGSREISFKESASDYGLDSPGFTTMAYFFDYDLDGDLDVILLNHNPKNLPNLNEQQSKELMGTDDPFKGSRLLRNVEGYFNDVTQESGIVGSELSYGLGVGIGDFNQDGWPDFYLSNDYNVPDFLYINNQDGTFSNSIHTATTHISQFSMGNDVADFNRDGLLDIFTLDMLPEDNSRQKLLMAPDNYSKFDLNLNSGFHRQFMRNMLQINNGNGTFSEIGQFAGISNTDWSWSALSEDYNNDGWNDLFITNGYTRDYTNLDFINYMNQFIQSKGRFLREDVLELIKVMPASNVRNYMFSGNKNLKLEDVSEEWGFSQFSNSNGAVFADLDNDGDLDLVVNNVNEPAFIYQNNFSKEQGQYIQIELLGESPNTGGIGAGITLYSKNGIFYKEHFLGRGYQSSVSPIVHFGLGIDNQIDSLKVVWPTGKVQVMNGINVNQRIAVKELDAIEERFVQIKETPIFETVPEELPFKDNRPELRDFVRQPLLFRELSVSGPVFKFVDFNKDGRKDFVVGGSKGNPTQIFLGNSKGDFSLMNIPVFEKDRNFHDEHIHILDLDGDSYDDLFIGSGGYHDFQVNDKWFEDRVYLQSPLGTLTKYERAIPIHISTGAVAFSDLNNDGFPDLFVGGKWVPGRYPENYPHYILMNNKKGGFEEYLQVLSDYGSITDAVWHDLNGDGKMELLIVGEWTSFSIFQFKNEKLEEVTNQYFSEKLSGLWNKIVLEDINGDDMPDIFLGNLGHNTQLEAPLHLYYGDFSSNGDIIPLMTNTIQGQSYPYVSRDELLKQMVSLKKKFPDYQSFSNAKISDILEDSSTNLVVHHLENTLLLSQPDKKYIRVNLPEEMQWSSVYEVAFMDYDKDGLKDFITFGNDSHLKLSIGRNSASYGQLFRNMGNGQFEYIPAYKSGLNIQGDVRYIDWFNDILVIGAVGMPLQSIRLNTVNQ